MSDEERTIALPTDAAAAPATTDATSTRGRAIGAVLCLVLAAVLMSPAAVAYWGQRTLNDTERYLATVSPLIDSPEVQDAIAVTVTDAIAQQVDTEALINSAFEGVITDRPRLQLLVGPLSSAVNSLIDQQVRQFIASDNFEDLWIRAHTQAQLTAVKLLRGEDTGPVALQGDQVVLDVSLVIDAVKLRLIERGLTIVDRVPIPEVDRQIVLVDAPQLRQMRTIYALGNPVATWLLPLVVGLFAAAYVLARRRSRMSIAIGLAFIANAALIAFALSVGRQLFVNELAGTVFGRASSVFYTTMLAYLDRGQEVVLWLGVILVAAGWFAGANAPGTAVRRTVTGALESAGAALPAEQLASPATWVAANVTWLRYVVFGIGVVVLAWGNNMNPDRLLWTFILVVALLAIIQVLVGAARRRMVAEPAPEPA